MPRSEKSQWPIAEILGRPVQPRDKILADISEKDYTCPFLHERCRKGGHSPDNIPLATCSVIKSGKTIITCPYRFYENDLTILHDVSGHFWPGHALGIKFVPNVKVTSAGNVDWFIVRKTADRIEDILGVELQAIDITGSVRPAFQDFINNRPLQKPANFGINYRNVSKRLLPQLLEKGRCFKAWRKKLAVVVQDALYENLEQKIQFAPVNDKIADIVFFIYSLELRDEEKYFLRLAKTVGMSHESLLTHVMYSQVPPLDEIVAKIEQRIEQIKSRS
jgi:hypothetical protein